MNGQSANLETRAQTNQANSTPDNKGVKPSSDGAAPNGPANEPKKPRSLAEIFGNSADETDLEINLSDNTPDDPNAPLDSIERLMKRHNLTPEQAYAIKIPMPNGSEALTIGEMKDKVSELVDLDIRATEFDERRIKQEGELLRSQNELRDILQMLPKEATTPAVLQKLRERQDNATRYQKQLTLEHIPEWRDEKRRTAEIEGISEMLGDYGFDHTFLASVVDHRAMKFIRDTYLMRSRIQKALAEVRDPKGIKNRPSGKGGKPPKAPNANSTPRKTMETQNDKLAAWFKSKE